MISLNLKIESNHVLLRPMTETDLEAFRPLVKDPSMWSWFTLLLDQPGQLDQWVSMALDEQKRRTRVPFTIIEKSTGAICGSSSYGNISPFDKRLEIGWSWLGKQYQGTEINFNAKFLLLSYAFDILDYERVEIKTDNLNERAKQGLRKIGAKEEGVLRSHMQMPLNRRRDSIYFSIIKEEWPEIRNSIFRKLIMTGFSENEKN